MFPILRTKLAIPPARVNRTARPRPLASLSAALARPVTLITAPAGFGKTTLLSEWYAKGPESGLAVAWLSLDPSDSSPVRFWTYVVAALRSVPALAARTDFGAATLSAFDLQPNPTADQFLTPLLNDIAAAETPFALVLDDYDLATGPEINAAMNLMLDRLPQNVRVVLLTRAEPGLPLGHLRARGLLSELRADDLRFTLPETTAFLSQAVASDLSDEDIDLLHGRTEGWVAGLQMAALSLVGRDDRHAFVASFAGDHRHLADYFAEEVLARQPQSVQTFLAQTSILERFCGPLCDAVTGSRGGQAMLERIEKANLFLVPLDNERHWYRYHRLLADLLRAGLQRSQPELIPVLQTRASQWFEQEGLAIEAVGHARAAKDWERVADISERNAPGWWAGASYAFADSSHWLPDEVVVKRPSLCILQSWGNVIQGRLEEASRLFDSAERVLLSRPFNDGAAMLSFIALARRYIAELTGQPYDVSPADYDAPAHIPETSVAMRNGADLVLSFILQMSGDLERAAPLLQGVAERDLRFGATSGLPLSISRLARLRLIQGRISDADTILRQYLATVAELGSRRYFVNGNLHAVLADVLRERNDLTEAARQADEGVSGNDAWGIPHGITLAYQAKARVLAALGDVEGAHALIDHEERIAFGRRLPSDLISERWALKVELWLAKGNLDAAERWARDSGLTPGDQPSFRREREHLTLARVLLVTERTREAVNLLTRLATAAAAGGRNGRLIEALVLLSAAQAETNSHRAVATLGRALALAEPEGYLRTFVTPGEPVARVLRLVAAEGKAAGRYAQRILNLGAPAVAIGGAIAAIPEPLSARELEVLGLLAAGMSNRDIAATLTLTISTVKTHVHSILGKLDAASRTQAIVRAKERGLLGG